MRIAVRVWIGVLAVTIQTFIFARSDADDRSAPPRSAASEPQTAVSRAWTFIYVMSYDNNLDHCTDPITTALAAGVGESDVAVTILSDRPGEGGLRQIRHTRDAGTIAATLETDDITDPTVLGAFLDWSHTVAAARRYVGVFLNHGGRLDDMCFDEHRGAGAPRGQGAMSASATSDVLRRWAAGLGESRVELLFVQQCGRASIENLYNFRGVAPHILASQFNVGACNTYYEHVVGFAGRNADADGQRIAREIAAADEHYRTYVLIDGAALHGLPAALAPVLAAIPPALTAASAPSSGILRKPRACFDVMNERNHDLIQTLRAAQKAWQSPPFDAACTRLYTWVRETLVREHFGARRAGTCGVSIHLPRSATLLAKYGGLPIYRETDLELLLLRFADAE